MQTASGIGYHILHDKMTPEQRARLLQHLAKLQPAVVNVAGAENYPASLDYVRLILMTCPNTLVFERRIAKPDNRGGDEGVWEYDLETWYDWRIRPYRTILGHPRVVVVYDNESMMDDLTPYANKMVAAAKRADIDGVALGLGRLATGNPGEQQYAQLDPMWRKLAGWRHWWTPNEYAGPTIQASAGHLFRYEKGWRRCLELKLPLPKTAIGETGVLAQKADGGLDPYKGRRSLGWSETHLADVVIDHWKAWYRTGGVPVSYFAAEAHYDDTWSDMLVGEEFYGRIEARMDEMQMVWDADAMGGKPYQEIKAEVVNTQSVNVRQEATTASAKIASIKTGDTIGVLPPVEGQLIAGLGNLWVPVWVEQDLIEGYAHAHYLVLPDSDPDAAAIRAHVKAQVQTLIEGLSVEVEAL